MLFRLPMLMSSEKEGRDGRNRRVEVGKNDVEAAPFGRNVFGKAV